MVISPPWRISFLVRLHGVLEYWLESLVIVICFDHVIGCLFKFGLRREAEDKITQSLPSWDFGNFEHLLNQTVTNYVQTFPTPGFL